MEKQDSVNIFCPRIKNMDVGQLQTAAQGRRIVEI